MMRLTLIQLDLLYAKHGRLTKYSNPNEAIIGYNAKEDKDRLTTYPPNTDQVANQSNSGKTSYAFIEKGMSEIPFQVNLAEFCASDSYFGIILHWGAVGNKLKNDQEANRNLLLKTKPGPIMPPSEQCESISTQEA